MAIYRLLQNSALEPEAIKRLTDAYEHSLRILNITDRSDPMTEIIAAKILMIGQMGEQDPKIISERAIKALNLPIKSLDGRRA